MNESVDSDAFVMPSSSGRPCAGRPPRRDHALVLLEEPELVHLLVDEELGVADVLDLHPPHHLPRDDLDVLVVDVDALQPVDLLDLVHQVRLQRLLAEHVQDVVRVRRPVHQRLAGPDALALLHVDVHAARQRVLARLGARLVRHDDDLPLPLDDAAVLHDAVDLRDDRRLARLARLEELHDARQTSRDVLGLGRLARNLREHVARRHHLAVLHHQVGVHRHVVLARHVAVLRLDLDRRLLLLVRRVHDDQAREARDLVHFLVHRDAFEDVLEAHLTRLPRSGSRRCTDPTRPAPGPARSAGRPSPSAARRRRSGSARGRGPSRPGRRASRCGSSPRGCRPWPGRPAGPGTARCRAFRASSVDCSDTRDAVPPMWNVRIVSCVPGSPIDCAAMTPTACPSSTILPVARSRP